MSYDGKVLVLGASGVIGQLIVEILQHDHPDIEVISGSRHARPGLALKHRYFNLLEPNSFASALEDIDVLIHAAGPFDHDPAPLIEACLDTATHYIDIAEDLHFIERVQLAAQARPNAHTCIVPGCSTVPGLVSVLSQTCRDLNGLSSIDVYLNLGSQNPVGIGLITGLLTPLGRTLNDGQKCFRTLRYRTHDDGIKRNYGAYPIPFRDGIRLGTQRYPVRFFVGFDRHYINFGLWGASFIVPLLSKQNLSRLSRLLLPIAGYCRRFGGEEGHLVLEARDAVGARMAVLEVIACRDGLKLPAAPAVWAAARLISHASGQLSGLHTLDDLVQAQEAVQWIRAHGYEVHDKKGTDLF